ncbi:hypothetical protein [Muriicola sp.]
MPTKFTRISQPLKQSGACLPTGRHASGALFLKEAHSENTKDQLRSSWV